MIRMGDLTQMRFSAVMHQNGLGSNLGKTLRNHPLSYIQFKDFPPRNIQRRWWERREEHGKRERGDCGNGHVPERKPGT